MSTKIYHAWRCPCRTFSEFFLPAFRHWCFESAAKKVGAMMDVLKQSDVNDTLRRTFKESPWPYKGPFKTVFVPRFEKAARLGMIFDFVDSVNGKLARDPADIDCSCNVFFHKGRAYVIPYGEYAWDDFRLPNVENYAYWNNTDPPKDVTPARWKARARTWDKVCLDDWDGGRLVHTVVGAKEAGYWEIARRVLGTGRYLEYMSFRDARG